MKINDAAEALHITPRKLREWMCLQDDPCPPGDPGADCDVAAIAAWMGRTGKGSRNGRQEALTANLDVNGAARVAQLAAASGAPRGGSEEALAPSDELPGLPELPHDATLQQQKEYWDARYRRLKALTLENSLIDREKVEQQNLLKTQRLIGILIRAPNRYAAVLANRTEKECRRILDDMIRDIRQEMASHLG